MKIYYSDTFELPLPDNHRFPMAKYRLLRQRLADTAHPDLELLIPEAATDDQLALVHDRNYLARIRHGQLSDLEIRRIGFPWSPQMMERSRRSVGASIAAARAALEGGVSVNLAGGTHHAFPDSGQGYCVFNDVAVAARIMQQERRAARVLFVDLDVHQGNGTAAIARDDPDLFSFSMHCEKNFPFRKETGDLDVPLPAGAGDDQFLTTLDSALLSISQVFRPDLVFYLAGADPWAGDRLGKLALSQHGLQQRDRMVFDFCNQFGLPCAVAMSGGYAPRVEEIVEIHFATVMAALDYVRPVAATGEIAPDH